MMTLNILIRFLAVFGIIFLIVIVYSFIEPYMIKNRISIIRNGKIKGSLKGLKIVFISDIHQGKLVSVKRVKDFVRRVNELKPDIVLLGGDYITWGADVKGCIGEIGKIEAKYGIYGVMGNHEHKTGLKESVEKEMISKGIKIVDNKGEVVTVGKEKINIGGVGDLIFDKQNITPVLENSKELFTILLSHNPDYVDIMKKEGSNKKIDLMISGDTHGGQVTFFGLWTPFLRTKETRKRRTGEIDIDGMKLIVSNGVGVLGVPLRLWAPPEINVILLEEK